MTDLGYGHPTEIDVKIRGVSLSEGKFTLCYPKEGEMSVRQAETTDECHNIHDTWLRGGKKCKMTSGKESIDTGHMEKQCSLGSYCILHYM